MGEETAAFSAWLQAQQVVEAYRFLYGPTFHRPLEMTLWSGPTGDLWCDIVLVGRGESADKTLNQPLDPAAWARLHEELTRCEFWLPGEWVSESGRDGSTWVFFGFNGSQGSQPQVREVWSAEPGTPASDLGWFFFNQIPSGFCNLLMLDNVIHWRPPIVWPVHNADILVVYQ